MEFIELSFLSNNRKKEYKTLLIGETDCDKENKISKIKPYFLTNIFL